MPPIKVKATDAKKILEKLFKECDGIENASEVAEKLSDFSVAKLLGVSCHTLERYTLGSSEDTDYSEMNEVFKALIDYRQRLCVKNIAKGGQVTGWIFLSKQRSWGGFQDVQKVENNGKAKIEISLNGSNGKPLGKT